VYPHVESTKAQWDYWKKLYPNLFVDPDDDQDTLEDERRVFIRNRAELIKRFENEFQGDLEKFYAN
jgi:hypothetical protein